MDGDPPIGSSTLARVKRKPRQWLYTHKQLVISINCLKHDDGVSSRVGSKSKCFPSSCECVNEGGWSTRNAGDDLLARRGFAGQKRCLVISSPSYTVHNSFAIAHNNGKERVSLFNSWSLPRWTYTRPPKGFHSKPLSFRFVSVTCIASKSQLIRVETLM